VTHPVPPTPCVVFALRHEATFFRAAFPLRQRLRDAPCGAELRGPALVLETGLGAATMERALAWLLGGPLRPSFVLSAGFSGGLCPGVRVGDLVLADEVADTLGNRWPTTWAGVVPSNGRRGRLLTAPTLVASPEEKRRLGQAHGAVAVDLETAAVARLCHLHGVPFTCLRAIFDDWNTPLAPGLVDLLREGRVAPWRVLAALLRRGRLVGELWRLARQARSAARNLNRGLEELLAGPGKVNSNFSIINLDIVPGGPYNEPAC
jgi:adenosylhomocysteine nucleosidase